MSSDEGPPHTPKSYGSVIDAALTEVARALDQALRVASVLPGFPRQALVTLLERAIRILDQGPSVSADGESGVNHALINQGPPDPTTAHLAIAENPPLVLPTKRDLSNRNHLSRYLDDVILFLLLHAEKRQQEVIFDDIRGEFVRVGRRQADGAIRTRLSRLRAAGHIHRPETKEKGESETASRRKIGLYALTTTGRTAAQNALKKRKPN